MRFRVTLRKLNVTDALTDGREALQYIPSRAFGAREIQNRSKCLIVHILTVLNLRVAYMSSVSPTYD